MKVIVVTGGIGSGKSLVCAMLAERGVRTYDSDTAAKRLYDTDAQLLASVVDMFGTEVLDKDGKLDRRALGAIVFSDPEKLSKLEALVHPAVFRDFASWKAGFGEDGFVVYESAIALEKGLPDGFADEIVYVDAPVEERVARACARDGRSKTDTDARVRAQASSKSDPRITYLIENNATVAELEEKVAALYDKLIRK